MNTEEMKWRTKRFGLRVMKLTDALPDTHGGKTIARQILRSGTSVGANYRSAVRARSKKEFISKLGVSLEECDESAYWLELIVEGELLPANKVSDLQKESDELCRILYTTIQSTKDNES